MQSRDGQSRFDLEERAFLFASSVRQFVKRLPHTVCNQEDVRQVVRSSGSIGANYIEANEALGRKDFRFRLRVARKEAKETRHWLRLLDTRNNEQLEADRGRLIQEAMELTLILTAIIRKSEI